MNEPTDAPADAAGGTPLRLFQAAPAFAAQVQGAVRWLNQADSPATLLDGSLGVALDGHAIHLLQALQDVSPVATAWTWLCDEREEDARHQLGALKSNLELLVATDLAFGRTLTGRQLMGRWDAAHGSAEELGEWLSNFNRIAKAFRRDLEAAGGGDSAAGAGP